MTRYIVFDPLRGQNSNFESAGEALQYMREIDVRMAVMMGESGHQFSLNIDEIGRLAAAEKEDPDQDPPNKTGLPDALTKKVYARSGRIVRVPLGTWRRPE